MATRLLTRSVLLAPRIARARALPSGGLAARKWQRNSSSSPGGFVLDAESMNPRVSAMEYAVRGRVPLEAMAIEQALKEGGDFPFKKVLYANIGNPQEVGQRPITIVRQVAAACLDPSLLEQGVYPSDVVQRAREILADAKGSSLGAYTDSRGLSVVRRHVAEFIESRDGSPADVSRIFLLNGASDGIKALIMTATPPEGRVGVMVPIPQYPIYTASITEFGAEMAPYYLDEERQWAIDSQELKSSVERARKSCNPRVMVVINPGNPTGQCLSDENIRGIIQFCHNEGLMLIADEVYQENIYQKGAKFVSFRKVLKSMGPEYKEFQLVSFHSTSKGYLGECGIRGGYMEMLGFNDLFIDQFYKLCSTKLCPNSIGQVATDVMVKPPQPNDPSFALFDQERRAVLEGLAKKAKMVYEELNKVPGVRCNEVQGSMYAFPQVAIPEEAWEDAKSAGLQLDEYYCLEFLKQKGVCVVPGSGFGQIPGTWHFRTTILPTEEDFKKMLKDFADFHCKFTAKYTS